MYIMYITYLSNQFSDCNFLIDKVSLQRATAVGYSEGILPPIF